MKFKCPHCQQEITIDDELAILESSTQCPSCGQDISLAEQSDSRATESRPTGKRPPWKKWKWRGSVARPSGAESIASGMGTALLVGITYACYRFSPEMFIFSKTGYFFILAWCLPIGAVIMFVRFLLRLFRSLRFRGARLRLLTHPGEIGGSFRAELVILQVLPRGTVLKACLVNQAINKVNNPNSKAYVTVARVFESAHDIQIDELSYRNGRYVIPLEYEIPTRAKDESDDTCTKTRTVAYCWRLEVKAKLVGSDMELDFPVPVFHKKDTEK
jgi:endogenous inhibitor of DNA gyrase (YacG/DUF329 family)